MKGEGFLRNSILSTYWSFENGEVIEVEAIIMDCFLLGVFLVIC